MKKSELFIEQVRLGINKENAAAKFSLVLDEIYRLLELIKLCKSLKEAEKYFILLAQIQDILATLMFRDNVELIQELKKIVRDCDRLDDKDVRDFLFDEIKNGTYFLKSDKFLWY
jgi:hypothetical protein